jgi:hypothetical protein
VLVSIELRPFSATRAVGQIQNYTAAGFFSDGSARNLTQRVDYSSSDPSVAVAPNATDNRSRVLAVGPGTALITAVDPITGIVSNTASLTVVGCAHDKCVVGTALTSDCDPCVTTICAADRFCCAVEWDETCVGEVESVCGSTCSGATG